MVPPLPCPIPAYGPVTWNDVPVAVELRPAGWSWGARYQDVVADVMGGPGASALFGPVVAEADVYWRFENQAPGRLELRPEQPAHWRDAAVAGTLVAVDRLLREATERAPRVEAARVTVASILDPAVLVVRTREGVRVDRPEGGQTGRDLERAEILDGDPQRRRAPSVGTGLDWSLREDEAPRGTPLLRYGAWVGVNNVGLTSLRAEYGVAGGGWDLVARQRLVAHTFLYGGITGRTALPALRAGEAGVMWSRAALPGWSLRLQYDQTWIGTAEQPPGWQVRLLLRGEFHTPIPAVPGRPLGERGLCLAVGDDNLPPAFAPLNPYDPATVPLVPSCLP